MSLRDRLVAGIADVFGHIGDGEDGADAALSVLTEGIEIVTPHWSGCEGEWYLDWRRKPRKWSTLACTHAFRTPPCPAEARIPERLLVELVEEAVVALNLRTGLEGEWL